MKPYLRVANVFEDHIDLSDLKTMHFDPEEFQRYCLHDGDVLLNEGQTPELLGRPAIYREHHGELAFTNSLIRFHAMSGVDPRWALAVFRHHMHSGRFKRESRITTNIAHLSLGRLRDVEFPVPPLEEQHRIVAILEDHLSRLDAADAGLARSQARLLALDRAYLEEFFGECGRTVALDELVIDISAGKSFGGASAPARDEEWGIIKVSAMTWGEFNPAENKAVASDRVDERYEIREGDLLVSRANTSDYVGASVLVGEVRPKLLLSDKSLRLTPREGVDPRWLWRALQAPSARRQISALATGTKDSMRNISQSSLRMVKLPKLSLDDQAVALESYESFSDSIGATRAAVAVQQRRSGTLRRALLAAAFSGRLTGSAENLSEAEEMIGT